MDLLSPHKKEEAPTLHYNKSYTISQIRDISWYCYSKIFELIHSWYGTIWNFMWLTYCNKITLFFGHGKRTASKIYIKQVTLKSTKRPAKNFCKIKRNCSNLTIDTIRSWVFDMPDMLQYKLLNSIF